MRLSRPRRPLHNSSSPRRRRPGPSFDRLRACPGPDPGTNESGGTRQPAERLCKGLPSGRAVILTPTPSTRSGQALTRPGRGIRPSHGGTRREAPAAADRLWERLVVL